ncbi:MAG: penicillin acylase family protein, partial [Cyclobacteriaceae bacterium]|nr:penicillin acylase family protein [Cyclobacteriaceae bacterium]
QAKEQFIPDEIQGLLNIQLKRLVDWIEDPAKAFGSEENRDKFLKETFETALSILSEKLGEEMSNWQYGQVDNKHVYIKHALGGATSDHLESKLNVGPMPRGGNAYTPGSTGSNLNQSSGASFRIIVDTGNWDDAIGTNAPGQSGNPDSKFYKNLFESWAKDKYFPVLYSKDKIENAAVERFILLPMSK